MEITPRSPLNMSLSWCFHMVKAGLIVDVFIDSDDSGRWWSRSIKIPSQVATIEGRMHQKAPHLIVGGGEFCDIWHVNIEECLLSCVNYLCRCCRHDMRSDCEEN